MSHYLLYKNIGAMFGKSVEALTAQKSSLSQKLAGQTWRKEQCA